MLEAVGHLALNEFQSLIAGAAALPQDQATPEYFPQRPDAAGTAHACVLGRSRAEHVTLPASLACLRRPRQGPNQSSTRVAV